MTEAENAKPRYWFRENDFLSWRYLPNFTPVTWEGWALTVLYTALLLVLALVFEPGSEYGPSSPVGLAAWWFVMTAATVALCVLVFKKGERRRREK